MQPDQDPTIMPPVPSADNQPQVPPSSLVPTTPPVQPITPPTPPQTPIVSQQPQPPVPPPAPQRSITKIVFIILIVILVLSIGIALVTLLTGKNTSGSDKSDGSAQSNSLRAISTPCYSTKIPANQQNNPAGSSTDNACHLATKNSDGSDTYEIIAENNPELSESTLTAKARAFAQDLVDHNGGSKISGQKSAKIGGSPASIVTLSNEGGGTATIALIYHVSNGYNSYIIDRFADQGSSDLGAVTKDWQWK